MRTTMYFVSLLVALSMLLASCASPTAIPIQPTSTLVPTPAPTPTLGIGSTLTRAKDGMAMVYVPKGPFTMGADNNSDNGKHTVTLNAFWIDQTEMTNARYAKCVKDGGCQPPVVNSISTHPKYYANPDFAEYPVVYVNWNMAIDYCEWVGGRLPTEAEWEKTARGTDGRTYPWGETLDNTYANYDRKDIAKVGSYENGKSPYGAYEMAGNVAEWVSSLPMIYPYNATDGREDLSASGERVVRGDAWYTPDNKANLTTFYRLHYIPNMNGDYIGFRCASSTAP